LRESHQLDANEENLFTSNWLAFVDLLSLLLLLPLLLLPLPLPPPALIFLLAAVDDARLPNVNVRVFAYLPATGLFLRRRSNEALQ
jgi:hypothetical protein